MKRNFVAKLYDSLLEDENYKKYCKIYEEEKYIDLDLLKSLLEKHHELYYIFLKIHILLYFSKEDKIMKNLNKDLKDYYYSNGRILRLDDIDLILRHYYTNFSRCGATILKIIRYNLVSKVEKQLLTLINSKSIKEQIIPIVDDEI